MASSSVTIDDRYARVGDRFWDYFSVADLSNWVCDARQRTFDIIADLDDAQLMGPKLPTTNPLLWEIGHVAWFYEKWILRHCAGRDPYWDQGDSVYDSIAIPHEVRWDLPLLPREKVIAYLEYVRDAVLDRLQSRPSNEETFHILVSVFHEDMHDEAFLINRQTWGYPSPQVLEGRKLPTPSIEEPVCGDVAVGGGEFLLGATRDEPFVFDNEKWAHPVLLRPFAISRAAVTQGEFAAFVEDGGYDRQELWSEEGWRWRQSVQAEHPVYWRRTAKGDWERRRFDQWLPLEADLPVINVCWYEADAYCRWANRRLPTEAEWEAAAALVDPGDTTVKQRFPWGDAWPQAEHANLDAARMGCVSVSAFAAGDSPAGCRQMIGNVWEWTATTFAPFPGFTPDPYKDYSHPCFGTRKVLRGGCWATRGRMLRNTWRNFYEPDRRDVWAGFRTCAREP